MTSTTKLSTSLAALALAAIALSGCTVTAPGAVQASEETTPKPAPTKTTTAQDKLTCAAFGDVMTIVGNVEVAIHEDRMGQQEKNGWYALASRVLANVPSADEGPVAEALAALKQEVPAVQGTAPVSFGTPGGPVFGADLHTACTDAGFEVFGSIFTGG